MAKAFWRGRERLGSLLGLPSQKPQLINVTLFLFSIPNAIQNDNESVT